MTHEPQHYCPGCGALDPMGDEDVWHRADCPVVAASSPAPPEHPFADMAIRPGQRVRVTFEAEVLTVGVASGNRGISLLRTRAGAGMCDGVWLVREPGYGRVLNLEVIDDGD